MAARVPLVIAGWLVLTVILMWFSTPVALAVAELRKLLFVSGIGVLVYAADRVWLVELGLLALIGRAGYGIYALHAPLTYMLVIYGVAWLAILAANIGLGIVIHLPLGRPLTEFGRGLRSRLVSVEDRARFG
jgi:hypothetical protein